MTHALLDAVVISHAGSVVVGGKTAFATDAEVFLSYTTVGTVVVTNARHAIVESCACHIGSHI